MRIVDISNPVQPALLATHTITAPYGIVWPFGVRNQAVYLPIKSETYGEFSTGYTHRITSIDYSTPTSVAVAGCEKISSSPDAVGCCWERRTHGASDAHACSRTVSTGLLRLSPQ